MRIGLVGKPNVGKSTLFAAATLADVAIANYPFCTIDPNVGVAYLPAPTPCPCRDLRERLEAEGRLEPVSETDERAGSLCTPRTGQCVGHVRWVPIDLVDIAGLVPGAHEGRGRGNAFLSDLAHADALIQVLDGAGMTDLEGVPQEASASEDDVVESMEAEVRFLHDELEAWVHGLLEEGWARGARRLQADGPSGLTTFLVDRLSGIGMTTIDANVIQDQLPGTLDRTVPWTWTVDHRRTLASHIVRRLFPLHLAVNKADRAPGQPWSRLDSSGSVRPTMADAELALRRAGRAGLITYDRLSPEVTINQDVDISEAQGAALTRITDRIGELGSTGVTELLTEVVFEALDHIVTYPVADETRWTDVEGTVLPDALLIPLGTTAKQMAGIIHSDLMDGFIRAVDGRSKRVVGADHQLREGDVIRVHART